MSVDIPDTIPVIVPDSQPAVKENLMNLSCARNFDFLQLARSLSRGSGHKNGITMVVLFFINLLNYMDRFSIAGLYKQWRNERILIRTRISI